jgi:hypothetical protein
VANGRVKRAVVVVLSKPHDGLVVLLPRDGSHAWLPVIVPKPTLATSRYHSPSETVIRIAGVALEIEALDARCGCLSRV